jgi:glycosyltransferase involved in cell wall biosynthesis
MSISIGIPFYNCEKFLPDAIRSVFAQTYQDWELILVDDGSTDRSLEIAKSVDDPRVRVFSDGKNRKLSARLNQIAAEAKYDLIARMDADDMMFPQRLEKQLRYFIDQEIQMVSSGICTITDENKIKSLRNCNGKYDITPKGFLQYRHRLMHPVIMARKQWFIEHPYDEQKLRCDDFELFLRCTIDKSLTNSVVRVIDEPLLFYREDNSQTLKKILVDYAVVKYTFDKHRHNLGITTNLTYRSLWIIRTFVYGTAAVLGILPFVKKLKDKPIRNKMYLDKLNKELQTVLQTPVSGMDEYLKQNYFASNDNQEIIYLEKIVNNKHLKSAG